MSEATELPEPAPSSSPPRLWRAAAVVVAAIVLAGAGVGIAVAVSGDPGGSSSPAAAVNIFLTAAQNSDLLGLLDAIAPGERAAIEPGLVTLIHQLQRLDVLAPSADPSKVSGLSFSFSGIETSTDYLESNVAAVTITHGTMTTGAELSKLPLGSFVTGLTGSLNGKTSSKMQSAATGRSAIVTVDDDGKWFVSLGYTIAVDALRSANRSDAIPAPVLAVVPAGAASPQGAVEALLDSIGAFDLKGLIADLAPGEMAALDSYAPRFLAEASAELAHEQSSVSVKFTGLETSTESLGSMTLVKVTKVGVTLTEHGITITVKGRCVTEEIGGRSKTTCTSGEQTNTILALLPADLKALVERLSQARPDDGIVTVEANGKWFVSPTATILQSINAFASILQPTDLNVVASYVRDPAAAKLLLEKLEQALLGSKVAVA